VSLTCGTEGAIMLYEAKNWWLCETTTTTMEDKTDENCLVFMKTDKTGWTSFVGLNFKF
jgi:hypothetical protein